MKKNIFMLLVMLAAVSNAATTYYVAPSPTGNDGNVGSEVAPFATIEKAVATSTDGDTVLVNNGTYTRSSTTALLINKAITLQSLNGRDVTHVVGSGTGDRLGWIVSNANARVTGFTLRSYKTNVSTIGTGSALVLTDGTVDNCAISNCIANVGSAIRVSGGALINSTIAFNDSVLGAHPVANYRGGGIFVTGTGNVRDCTIFENKAAVGAGVSLESTTASVTGCTIRNNRCNGLYFSAGSILSYGGGVYLSAGLLDRCTITGNEGAEGGGIWSTGGTIRNCLVAGNRSIHSKGGGIYANGATVQLQNVTVADNYALCNPGTELYLNAGSATNLIVAGSARYAASSDQLYIGATAAIGYSALPVTVLGSGNVLFNRSNVSDTSLRPYPDTILATGGYELSGLVTNDLSGIARSASPFSIGCLAATNLTAYACRVKANKTTDAVGMTVAFEADVFNSAGTISEISWDFGDGGTDTGATVTHTFNTPGTHTVTLSVTDSISGVTTATFEITAAPEIVYVATDGSNTYPFDTLAKATTNLQSAIETVYCSDTHRGEVVVAEGSYTDLTNASTSDFSPMVAVWRHVEVRSSGVTDATILDTQVKRQAMVIGNAQALVTGLTLKDGRFNIARQYHAGNLWLYNGTVSNCLVTGGYGDRCGNVVITGGRLTHSRITKGTLFVSGVNRPSGGVNMVKGGLVEYCDIYDNNGGYGAGLYIGSSSPNSLVRHCRIFDNYGSKMGGAGVTALSGLIDSCVIVSNSSPTSAGGAAIKGGTLRNSLVAWNTANGTTIGTTSGGGGGVFITGGQLQNCTVFANTSMSLPSAHGLYQTGGTVVNTIVYANGISGNSTDEIEKTGGTFTYGLTSSPALNGNGNITTIDPMFTDPDDGDFTLLLAAPGVDAGTAIAAVTNGMNGVERPAHAAYDMGCYEMSFGNDLICSFTANSIEGVNSLTTLLHANVSGGSGTLHYRWDFGGGNIMEGDGLATVEYTFGTGASSVTLTVTDSMDETTTLTRTSYIQVSPGTTYAAPDGTSIWPYNTWATAATNIQDAVDAVYASSETPGFVRVADGIYQARSNTDVYVLTVIGPISVIGTNANGSAIIDADGARRVAYLANEQAQFVNLTFKNGSSGSASHGYAGGLWLLSGTVTNCIIRDNFGLATGGMVLYDGLVTDTLLTNNTALTHTGLDRLGGAAYLFGGTMERCVITGNQNARGGGLYLDGDTAVVRDCQIINNTAEAGGGGVRITKGLVDRCLIANNTQGRSTQTLEPTGAGVYLAGASARLQNSLVLNNTHRHTSLTGAGIQVDGGLVLNVTAVGNVYTNDGAAVGLDIQMAGGTVANTIAGALTETAGISTANYVGGDPSFRNPEKGDYSLRNNSPCLNAGDNSFWTAAINPLDYVGDPRIHAHIVDIGALEFSGNLGSVIVVR